jgi:hypothetical protein
MCQRKTYRMDMPAMAMEGAYEGQTVRLDPRDVTRAERRARRTGARYGGFPWWTLWLIWPLLVLGKWFVSLYIGAAAVLFAQFSAIGAAPIIAIALIVVGLVLIGRN